MAALREQKVLVVGCTGQVALPVAVSLAADNEVWGIARFQSEPARHQLEEAGVRCVPVDLATPDLTGIPEDFTYVLNFSVAKTGSWSTDLDVSAGAVALLMERCRYARAFLHCSSVAVYQAATDHVFVEEDPLGDNHRAFEKVLPFLATYSISKIAAEVVARYASKRWNLPTVIARLNVPYGDNGGWPALHLEMMAAGLSIAVHGERPNRFNPIHEDDICATVQPLLDAATVPPVVVNWGGAPSSIEQWCAHLATLTGIEPKFEVTADTISGLPVDTRKLTSLTGHATGVPLIDGLRRMVAARRPDLLQHAQS